MNIFRKHKTIEDLLPGFLLEKETESKYRTSVGYNTHILILVEWLNSKNMQGIAMDKITPVTMAEFFHYLAKVRGLDRPTCERYFMHVRAIFNYAKKLGEVKEAPMNLVVFPQKGKDKSAEVIHAEDLKMLLTEIKRTDPQLYLACMTIYYCFIRPGRELRLMKIGDIDIEREIVTVVQENAKNSKRQAVTIPRQLAEIFIEYGIDKADKELYIFGNKKKFGTKPCSINMLRYRFNVIRDRLGLPKGYKLYSMKHTGASALHLSGISMRELMDQLRHTKLEATQHYLKVKTGMVNTRIRDNFPSIILD